MGRIRYCLTALAVFFCAFANGLAQDSNFVRKNIAALTSHDMYGRGGAHDGELKAATYIREQLVSVGAMPLGENGFQKWTTKAHKMEGKVSMSVKNRELSPFWDYRIAPYSHSLDCNDIPVVRVDASLLVDTPALEKFVSSHLAQLKGSLVYIDGVKWKHKKDIPSQKIQACLRSLTFNNPFQSAGILVGVDELPVWGLSNTDFQRNYAYIYVVRNKLPKSAKTVSLHFQNECYLKHTQNVCFAIEGTTHPDEFVILTAHYDHLGCMGDSVIFFGAHDNASGTSAVMDFARHFSKQPLRYTTVFLLFSGEESGLKGSKYFVEHPLVPLEKVKMVVNIDMFCGGDEGITVVNSDGEGTAALYNNMVKINEANHYIAQVKPRTNAANSDHYFFSLHCPAIFIYTMGGQYGGYHHFTDTCDRCGLNCYNNLFSLIKEALEQL